MASVSPEVERATDRMSETAQVEANELREKAGEMMHSMKDVGIAARHAAQEQLGTLRDSAGEYIDRGRVRAARRVRRSNRKFASSRTARS